MGKNVRAALLLAGLLFLLGCAGEPFRLELPQDHPANPAAAEAPLPPPSSALDEGLPQPIHRGAPSPGGEPSDDGEEMGGHHH